MLDVVKVLITKSAPPQNITLQTEHYSIVYALQSNRRRADKGAQCHQRAVKERSAGARRRAIRVGGSAMTQTASRIRAVREAKSQMKPSNRLQTSMRGQMEGLLPTDMQMRGRGGRARLHWTPWTCHSAQRRAPRSGLRRAMVGQSW